MCCSRTSAEGVCNWPMRIALWSRLQYSRVLGWRLAQHASVAVWPQALMSCSVAAASRRRCFKGLGHCTRAVRATAGAAGHHVLPAIAWRAAPLPSLCPRPWTMGAALSCVMSRASPFEPFVLSANTRGSRSASRFLLPFFTKSTCKARSKQSAISEYQQEPARAAGTNRL